MRADSPWQPVVDRTDLDLAFENAKSPFDVGQTLVSLHHLGRRCLCVDDQQQLAVELLQVALFVLVNVELEVFAFEIDLDEVRPSCFGAVCR